MLLTEQQIKDIILEEALKYIEEARGSMTSKQFQDFLKHMPFTAAHREKFGVDAEERKNMEVYELVVGGTGQSYKGKQRESWPSDKEDKGKIASWFVRNYPDLNSVEDILNPSTGVPKMKWNLVQQLVRKKFAQEPEVQQAKKKYIGLAEIIKEEVIKYLKENE